jgi:hypothetical protein
MIGVKPDSLREEISFVRGAALSTPFRNYGDVFGKADSRGLGMITLG